VKLTTTKLFVGLFALTAVAVVAGLLWLTGHSEEEGGVRGPASMMRKLKMRQKMMADQEARAGAQALENATHDLGLSGAAAK
jgi:hypothetical protein